MMIVKRTLALFALCLLLCSACLPIVFAADSDNQGPGDPPVDWQIIQQANCSLAISGGEASIRSNVRGTYGSTTSCKIELKLQKRVLFWWSTVETWEKTQADYQTSLNVSYPITSGKSYRAVAVLTVWNGSSSESTTRTTATVEAP